MDNLKTEIYEIRGKELETIRIILMSQSLR